MKCGKLLRTLKTGENYNLKQARKYGGEKVYVEVERGRGTKDERDCHSIGEKRENLIGIQKAAGD